jgi:deoxycytidylate deaminase
MHEHYFKLAAEVAKSATCTHAKCGSIIVSKDNMVIGRGFNAPPLELESQRYCDAKFDMSIKPKYDKTCCIHAEWNAIIDALKNNSDKIDGSTLYFMRIDDRGNFTDAGDPFCTVCSRLALQSGIRYFALWNKEPKIYECTDYNQKSYEYHIKNR